MKYLCIENQGLIDVLDLTSLGLSSKRNDNTKIGQFGSGLKYATPWLLRNEVEFKIFSGLEEIIIDTEMIVHREQPVSFITVNGRKTDITTGFGEIDWQAWMVIRELVSNAIDEGGFRLTTVKNIEPVDNITKIYIEMTETIKEIMTNYHYYFSFDKLPSYENKYGRLFIKPIQDKSNIYRKGIRCSDYKILSLIDVDFTDIDINESRLANPMSIDMNMRKLLQYPDIPVNIWEALFNSEYRDWLPIIPPNSAIEALKVLSIRYNIQCPMNISVLGLIGLGIIENNKKTLIIPNNYYNKCVELKILDAPQNIEKIGDTAFIEIEDSRKDLVEYYLRNIGYPIKVKFGAMDFSKDIIIKNDMILIKNNIDNDALTYATLIIQTLPLDTATTLLTQYFE